ncbi:DotU family type IV/VI secretion system protein [Hylemonella sp. W303a]|uniref:DotU family type IV/VI secretion system protein n=1 Tax=Hylemonella sp. W303a TaxID=3389873 RepID=UPI00396AF168
MSEAAWSDSRLVSSFADYYSELSEYKLAIREGKLQQLLQGELSENPTMEEITNAVRRRLLNYLKRQQLSLERGGAKLDARIYRRAQYVMASLSDEVFLLELDWPGAQHWLTLTLEDALFGSRLAGRLFFRQIESLPRLGCGPSTLRDLAAVHLLALQLGFKGECRGKSGAAALERYREQLIQLLSDRRRGGADVADLEPFSQAGSYTLSERHDERLAPIKPWYRYTAISLLIYLLLTSVLWLGYLVPFVSGLKSAFL